MKQQQIIDEYQQSQNKRLLLAVIVSVLIATAVIWSLVSGAVQIPLADIISVLLGQGSNKVQAIIWNIRLPRILTALVAGGGLAIAGAVMQSMLRNPLGSPYTLGISHAAAFGASFSIIVFGTGAVHSSSADAVLVNNPYLTSGAAFVCAVITTSLIVAVAKYRNAATETMILTGVALGSLFTAGTTALQYFASDVEIASIVFWTFGDVGRVVWSELGFMFLLVAGGSIYFIYNRWNYNALDAGDETAKSLGVAVDKVRLGGMFIASLLTSLIVSLVGIIGFVGLVAPHIVRKISGGNEKYLLPLSALTGGLLLLVSDTAARTVIAPVVLPVGILTSFLGVPLFLYLIIKGRQYW